MPTGIPLDLTVIHQTLWEKADRRHVVTLDQKALAAQFGVNKFTLSRKIAELLETGRIHKVSNNRNARGKFVVHDPTSFADTSWIGRQQLPNNET